MQKSDRRPETADRLRPHRCPELCPWHAASTQIVRIGSIESSRSDYFYSRSVGSIRILTLTEVLSTHRRLTARASRMNHARLKKNLSDRQKILRPQLFFQGIWGQMLQFRLKESVLSASFGCMKHQAKLPQIQQDREKNRSENSVLGLDTGELRMAFHTLG